MSCCGKKREQFTSGPPNRPHSVSPVRYPAVPQMPARPSRPGPLQSRVFFEYVGQTALTVVGRATGKQYRFERRGARLEVDLRDRLSMTAVPHLRQLAPGDFRTAR